MKAKASTFCVTLRLPLDTAAASAGGQVLAVERRALVVDDAEVCRRVLAELARRVRPALRRGRVR